jgi:tetratricopeptide (TPR) repeat protein
MFSFPRAFCDLGKPKNKRTAISRLGYTVLWATAILIISGGASVVATSAESPGVAAVMQQAAQLYGEGRLPAATAVLEHGLRQYPNSAQLHFMLGNALMRAHSWTSAIPEYQTSAALRPQFSDTYLNLGYAYYHTGNTNEAVEAWHKAVALSPMDALPDISLALGLHAAGQEHAAHECMMRAISLDRGWNRRVAQDFRWSPDMLRDIDELAKASGNNPRATSQHL